MRTIRPANIFIHPVIQSLINTSVELEWERFTSQKAPTMVFRTLRNKWLSPKTSNASKYTPQTDHHVEIDTSGQQRSILDCFDVFPDEICSGADSSPSLTSPRTDQWSPAIWEEGITNLAKERRTKRANTTTIMGQKSAQVKFTVAITIVQAILAVFFGLFVRCRQVSFIKIKASSCLRMIFLWIHVWLFESGTHPLRTRLTRRTGSRMRSLKESLPSIQVSKKITMEWILPIIYCQLISSVIIDIHVMLFAGFGFLMTFLKNYGYSAISFTVMITVIITEFGILCFGISRFEDGDYTIKITMIEWVVPSSMSKMMWCDAHRKATLHIYEIPI